MTERFDSLIEEIKAVREGVEELYIVLDHMWRNREELAELLNAAKDFDPTPNIPIGAKVLLNPEQFAKAMETVDQIAYCCENPQLVWEGDSDTPGVSCASCGYVVAENGALVVSEKGNRQSTLFEK